MTSASAPAPLRLAIVGAGGLSSTRIFPSLHLLPVELVAVCDLDVVRARSVGSRFGSPAIYGDATTMLDQMQLDAVIVCVGPQVHHDLAIEIMERGLPVYTEKPPAPSVAGAFEMLEASRRTGQLCMTGFKKRFAPAYRKARVAIDSQSFGPTTLVSIHHASGPGYVPGSSNPRESFLLDFGIHAIDLARYLGGEVREVFARASDEAAYSIALDYASGAVGTISLSANRIWEYGTERTDVTGGPGQFLTVTDSIVLRRFDGIDIADWNSPNFSIAKGDSLIETGFALELREFVEAVTLGTTPESTIESSWRTLQLYDAIEQSVASSRPVEVGGA
jgi:predicted dehydrogenase